MKGKTIGYIRVSSIDQNIDRQLQGIDLDKVFIEEASGKYTKRPVLQQMLDYIREDDVIYVHSLDRLSRSLRDLLNLVNILKEKKVEIKFIKENLVFNKIDDSRSMLMLSIMASFAEFERSIIKERQMEGIQIAKAKGLYKGGKKKLNEDQIKELKHQVLLGFSKTKVAKDFKISRESVYQYLKR